MTQTESILSQHGSTATVEIALNNNYFAPALYRAAANELVRKIVIEDFKKEGLDFCVKEAIFPSGGREWRFILASRNINIEAV